MTLVVGILCEGGVVVAADGAATLGSMGEQTVRQPVHKLQVIAECIVLGVSGPVGLAQRFAGKLNEMWDNKEFSASKPHEAMQKLRMAFFEYVGPEMKVAHVAAPVVGPAAAAMSAISASVVALPIAKEPCLFQFDHQCAPEQATADLPFVAIGSGQRIADPFLALIRRTYWPDRLPSIPDGLFAACWTLAHAIQTMPGGVADPLQAIVLKKESNRCVAVPLAENQLQEHREAAAAAEEHLRKFKREIGSDEPSGDAPEIPQPGGS